MRDNIIIAPLGRAVTFFALGQVVVARNRLVTQGSTRRGLDLIAATVLIGNFGFSNEWTIGLLLIMILGLVGKKQLTTAEFCELALVGGLVAPTSPPSLWPPLVRRWATGKTLFVENQVTLDLDSEQRGFGLSSISIFTLDDLGLMDNQVEVTSTNFFCFLDAALFGGSLRVNDNRFSETWMRTLFSALTLGLMNTTTDNQSTHCIQAAAILPGMRVFKDNLALVNSFCPNQCRGNGND